MGVRVRANVGIKMVEKIAFGILGKSPPEEFFKLTPSMGKSEISVDLQTPVEVNCSHMMFVKGAMNSRWEGVGEIVVVVSVAKIDIFASFNDDIHDIDSEGVFASSNNALKGGKFECAVEIGAQELVGEYVYSVVVKVKVSERSERALMKFEYRFVLCLDHFYNRLRNKKLLAKLPPCPILAFFLVFISTSTCPLLDRLER